jgi:hypothetical protein
VADSDPQFAKSYADLRARTDGDLIREHDQILTTGAIGTEYYLNELARRTAERQTSALVEQTKKMVRLTWVIVGLTLVNLGFVIYAATK